MIDEGNENHEDVSKLKTEQAKVFCVAVFSVCFYGIFSSGMVFLNKAVLNV